MEFNGLRAEITLGLRAGDGSLIPKADVGRFLRDEITRAKAAGERFVPMRRQTATVDYPNQDGRGQSEPALILSSDRNPRYNADLSDDEWQALVEALADKLARHFDQARVYITYLPVQVKIIQGGRQ